MITSGRHCASSSASSRTRTPRFTRSFEARQTRLARHPHKLGARLAVVSATLLAAVTLLAGSLTGALAIVLTTWLIWVAWSHSAGTDRPAS